MKEFEVLVPFRSKETVDDLSIVFNENLVDVVIEQRIDIGEAVLGKYL